MGLSVGVANPGRLGGVVSGAGTMQANPGNGVSVANPLNQSGTSFVLNQPTAGGGAPAGSTGGGSGGGSGGGGGGGGTAPVDYSAQIAGLDSQANRLRQTLGSADTQLNQGLSNIDTQFGQQQNAANTTHSRALQDFQTQNQNDNLGHQQAIDQVNTKARTLANSVRQMIGNASGSGSSAYQVTAPSAVERQANLQSQDINNSFGQNMTALKTAEDRNNEDYTSLLGNLNNTKNQAISSLRSGILNQKNQINGQLADLMAQRAAYAGGGASAVKAATSPYEANIAANQAAIDGLFNQYKTPFAGVQPLTYQAPTLRDYATGKTNVAVNPDGTQTGQTATYNPLATWKQDDPNAYAF